MEFFENQVGEFRNLLGTAAAPSPGTPGSAVGPNSAHHQHHHHQHEHPPLSLSHHQPHAQHQLQHSSGPMSAAATPGHGATPLPAQLYGAASTPTSSAAYPPARAAPGSKRKNTAPASIGDDDDGDASPGSRGGAAGQRSKRSRYISIACNECKRRKIKCNGETPCQRCGNLNLQCLYAPNCCSSSVKDSDEFKHMDRRVSGLQDQVTSLFNSLAALRSEAVRLAPIQDRVLPLPSAGSTPTNSNTGTMVPLQRPELPPFRAAGFRGPTSTHFSLDVAKKTLHKMGYSNLGDGTEDTMNHHGSPVQSPLAVSHASPVYQQQAQQQYPALQSQQQQQPTTQPALQAPTSDSQSHDPLWDFEREEILHLCQLHEDDVGIMYPVVKIETVIQHAKNVATWMEAARESGYVQRSEKELAFADVDTLVLKVIMALALTVEEHGNSERATRLFESARPFIDRMLMSDPSDIKYLPLLALSAGYRFFNNEEILAWRVMGQVTRHCLELGLHRRDAIDRIETEESRVYVVHTFWTAYVIDRRWALATGLPWSIPDEEIDPQLPYPDNYPFLVSMIDYSRLNAQVWKLVRQFDGQLHTDLLPTEIEDIDLSIKKWYKSLPEETQLELSTWEVLPQLLSPQIKSPEYDLQRTQIWTYLRLNQVRILLYTPILHTHSCIMENLEAAERVVQVAKNTIRYLSHLHSTTNIYRRMQIFYHQFLTSAIAVLFLASCHAPVNFSSTCRDEFYMALELVKDMSAKSFVSRRLWSTIKSLKEVAPRLGLAEDPHSSAALTMAGLATGHRHAATQGSRGGGSSMYASSRTPVPVAATTTTSATATASPFPTSTTGGTTPGGGLVDNLQNGHQISSEMSKIFEGYMGTTNGFTPPPDSVAAGTIDDGTGSGDGDGADTSSLVGASVYQHFRDMF
ncbi:proline utilization trans-activator [Microdochium nivale]|nr:proline utilization trans-activator [Microdochium nivale]